MAEKTRFGPGRQTGKARQAKASSVDWSWRGGTQESMQAGSRAEWH